MGKFFEAIQSFRKWLALESQNFLKMVREFTLRLFLPTVAFWLYLHIAVLLVSKIADWIFNGKGEHDRDNAALAFQVARLFKVDDEKVREILEKWKSLKGRLEFVKKIKNIEFYKDLSSSIYSAGFSKIQSRICKINPPASCLYWNNKSILVPIIFK